MEDLLELNLADLRIAVQPLLGGLTPFATSYARPISPAEAATCDLHVTVTPQMITAERELSTEGQWADEYLQQLAVYRAIAEQVPKHNVFLMHAAVIGFGGKAYAFTAASGTGKSTHLRLWKRCLGDAAQVINGDKPLLRVNRTPPAEPAITAYGTPWCGKEGWQANAQAPLAGLCLLERGSVDACEQVAPSEALSAAMRQAYMPHDAESAFLTLGFLDALLGSVPVYRLRCTMEPSAVRASFEAMTGLSFDDHCLEKDRNARN